MLLMLTSLTQEVHAALEALNLYDTSQQTIQYYARDDYPRRWTTGGWWCMAPRRPAAGKCTPQQTPPTRTICLCLPAGPDGLTRGPCEHAYACLEQEGQIKATVLAKPKPKGRPKAAQGLFPEASRVPGIIVPSPDLQPAQAPLCPANSIAEAPAEVATSAHAVP